MTKIMTPRSLAIVPLWIATRRMILTTLRRSANKVLLTREISDSDHPARRWLPSDVYRFMSQVASMADHMRAVAKFDALPRVGSRLMVEMAILTSAAYRVLLDDGVPAARVLVANVGWGYDAGLLRLTSFPFRLTPRDTGVSLQRTFRSAGDPRCDMCWAARGRHKV